MQLRRSAFSHALPLGPGRWLLIHAITQMRLAVDDDAVALLDAFATPRELPEDMIALARDFRQEPRVLAGAVAALLERGFLTPHEPGPEAHSHVQALTATGARNPAAQIDALRRQAREGAHDYWAARETRALSSLAAEFRRIDVALIGDCDVQMEAEYLAMAGRAIKLDLRVATCFPDDLGFVGERRFDTLIVGASRLRGFVFEGRTQEFIAETRRLLTALRSFSAAPILIDNLPEPTLQPLGLSERGAKGHRNRVRGANLALAELVEEFTDIHIADIAHALSREGVLAQVDDGLVSFTHLGAPGWLLQRPRSELAAVHNLMPPPDSVAALVNGDAALRERIVADTHLDALRCVLAIDAKKVVVVDLDGVLWPGVLAETGAPFAWSAEISGLASYIGVYVGLHEALKTLKLRGVLLACASRNDEAVVQALWRYPDHYPRERLLTLDDFVTRRIGWTDKATALREMAVELGLELSSFVFIDDSPREREHVRAELPQVEVWGEDLFALRRRILDDPRLQRPRQTAEASARADLVRAQLARDHLRAGSANEAAFLASLGIVCDIFAPSSKDLPRIAELFSRTTQFNATGVRLSVAELEHMSRDCRVTLPQDAREPTQTEASRAETSEASGFELTGVGPEARQLTTSQERGFSASEKGPKAPSILAMRVRDRLADHGLVAAAVVSGGEIVNFVMSCRVIGMRVEQNLLSALVAAHGALIARIAPTDRNAPVRHLYRDGGFVLAPDGVWRSAIA